MSNRAIAIAIAFCIWSQAILLFWNGMTLSDAVEKARYLLWINILQLLKYYGGISKWNLA